MRQKQIEQVAGIILGAWEANAEDRPSTDISIARQNRDQGFSFETSGTGVGGHNQIIRHTGVRLSSEEMDQAFRLADQWS